MRIHILGISGTFMAGIAILARALGHEVSGSDANVYPPMSTQLEEEGIALIEGYDPAQLDPVPDIVIVGNAMSRGNPCVEHILDSGIRFTSGPQWVHDEVLHGRHVLAVSGTHGKTTTTSMLGWVLDAVVVLPWVPETASTCRPGNTSSFSHWGPEVKRRPAFRICSTHGLPLDMALPTMTRSGAGSS